jgi:hypothetical protein
MIMLMMGKLYDALLAAKVPDNKAREAAEEAAQYENRVAKIESDLAVLKWMSGVNTALAAAILVKLLV